MKMVKIPENFGATEARREFALDDVVFKATLELYFQDFQSIMIRPRKPFILRLTFNNYTY